LERVAGGLRAPLLAFRGPGDGGDGASSHFSGSAAICRGWVNSGDADEFSVTVSVTEAKPHPTGALLHLWAVSLSPVTEVTEPRQTFQGEARREGSTLPPAMGAMFSGGPDL